MKTKVLIIVLTLALASIVAPVMAAGLAQAPAEVVSDFWSTLAERVLLAVAPMLAVGALGWLVVQIKVGLARARELAPDLIDALCEAANLAVNAAEQSKLASLITDKKAYALTVAEDFLKAKGIHVDLHLIEAAIERAVLENFPKEPNLMGFK